MSKVPLNNLSSLANSTTAINTINGNNTTITTAFDNTLSRDGTTPNSMGANLDMNSQRIVNLPAPIAGTEPVRLTDIVNGFNTSILLPSTPLVQFDTIAVAQAKQIDPTVNWLTLGGYYSAGDGGGGTYKRVGSLPTFPGYFQSADGAYWQLFTTDGQVNVRQFGTKADDSTDDLPAFNNALEYLKGLQHDSSSTAGPSRKLFIPYGTYFLSGPLNVHLPVHIFGVGAGQINNPGTVLRFGTNQNGVVFHEYRTLDNGGGNSSTDAGLGDAQGSTLEGLSIWGGGAQSISGPYTNAANNTGTGVWIRTGFVICRDVGVAFCNTGFLLNATAGSSGATAGNASNFNFEYCRAEYCSFDGFSIYGSDSNTGIILRCSAESNGASGFREYSFLGNSYYQCHTRDNGTGSPNSGNGVLGGTCSFGGQAYYLVGGTDGFAQAALASTTQPGTNSSVWNPFDIVGSPPTWTTGKSWTVSGPYVTNPGNVNAKNVFVACYAELGQAPIQCTYPTMFVGGAVSDLGFDLNGSPGCVINSGTGQFNSSAPLASGGGFTTTYNYPGMVSNPGGGSSAQNLRYGTGSDVGLPGRTLIGFDDNVTSVDWQWIYDGTSTLRFEYGHSYDSEMWTLSNFSGSILPQSHVFRRFYLSEDGNITSAKRFGLANQLSDLNGVTVQQGDRFFYTGGSAGSPAGMGSICTTSGVIGSSATMVDFGTPAGTTPSTKTTNYTATNNDVSLIFNGAGSITLTLPTASSLPGKWFYLRTIAAQTVVSASSNVVPLAGGAAGTAILAATAGKWAAIQSDGTNWQIMMSN